MVLPILVLAPPLAAMCSDKVSEEDESTSWEARAFSGCHQASSFFFWQHDMPEEVPVPWELLVNSLIAEGEVQMLLFRMSSFLSGQFPTSKNQGSRYTLRTELSQLPFSLGKSHHYLVNYNQLNSEEKNVDQQKSH